MAKSTKTKRQRNLLERFDLVQIRLVHSETVLATENGKRPKHTKINLSHGYSATRDDAMLRCNLSCEVISDDGESDERSVMVRCAYQAIYKCKTKSFPAQKTFDDRQAEVVGASTMQMWPFIRHFVHWTTTQMGLPALTLPMAITDMNASSLSVAGKEMVTDQPKK